MHTITERSAGDEPRRLVIAAVAEIVEAGSGAVFQYGAAPRVSQTAVVDYVLALVARRRRGTIRWRFYGDVLWAHVRTTRNR